MSNDYIASDSLLPAAVLTGRQAAHQRLCHQPTGRNVNGTGDSSLLLPEKQPPPPPFPARICITTEVSVQTSFDPDAQYAFNLGFVNVNQTADTQILVVTTLTPPLQVCHLQPDLADAVPLMMDLTLPHVTLRLLSALHRHGSRAALRSSPLAVLGAAKKYPSSTASTHAAAAVMPVTALAGAAAELNPERVPCIRR